MYSEAWDLPWSLASLSMYYVAAVWQFPLNSQNSSKWDCYPILQMRKLKPRQESDFSALGLAEKLDLRPV